MTDPGTTHLEAESWTSFVGAVQIPAVHGPYNSLVPADALQVQGDVSSHSPYRSTQRTTQSADLPVQTRGPPTHQLPRHAASVRSYSDYLDLLYTQQGQPGQLASQISAQEIYAPEAAMDSAPWDALYTAAPPGNVAYSGIPNHETPFAPLPGGAVLPPPSGIDLVSLLMQYNASNLAAAGPSIGSGPPYPMASTMPADCEFLGAEGPLVAHAGPSPGFSAPFTEPLHSLVVTLLEDYLAGTAGRAPGSLNATEIQALRRGLAIVEGMIGERLRATQARRAVGHREAYTAAAPPQYRAIRALPFYPDADGRPTWHAQPAPPMRAGGGAAALPAAMYTYTDTFTSAPAVLRPFEFGTTYHRAGGSGGSGAATPDLFAPMIITQGREGQGGVSEAAVRPGYGPGEASQPQPASPSLSQGSSYF